MPGYNSQRRGTARTLPKKFVLFYVLFVLCRSVYCLCVNVYSTTATGWQPNCSLTDISYHIISSSLICICVCQWNWWTSFSRMVMWTPWYRRWLPLGVSWHIGGLWRRTARVCVWAANRTARSVCFVAPSDCSGADCILGSAVSDRYVLLTNLVSLLLRDLMDFMSFVFLKFYFPVLFGF
jgi:hypothetical protein